MKIKFEIEIDTDRFKELRGITNHIRDEFKTHAYLQAMRQSNGNITHAAKLMKMNRNNLSRDLLDLGIREDSSSQ